MNAPGKQHILVADREPAIRRHICDFLQRMGYHADAALNGDEVAEYLVAREYCLLLLDAELTTGDGGSLETWVADRFPQVPVVIMSSAPSVRAVIAAMRRGVFDYIIKPYEILELSSIVPRAITRYQTRSDESGTDTGTSISASEPISAVD